LRVVVVDEHERTIDRQGGIGREDRGVLVRLAHTAHIQFVNFLSVRGLRWHHDAPASRVFTTWIHVNSRPWRPCSARHVVDTPDVVTGRRAFGREPDDQTCDAPTPGSTSYPSAPTSPCGEPAVGHHRDRRATRHP